MNGLISVINSERYPVHKCYMLSLFIIIINYYYFLCSMIECKWLREGHKPVFEEELEDTWMEAQEEMGRGQIMQDLVCHALCQAM